MAFTGLHVACAKLGTGINLDSSDPRNGQFGYSLPGRPIWSETLGSAGTTTRGASSQGYDGRSFLWLKASVDAFVAIGLTPNASLASGEGEQARFLLRVGEELPIICNAGDRVAWMPA